MSEIDSLNFLADLTKEVPEFTQINDMLTQIMTIPDATLTPEALDMMKGAINGAFTDNIRENIVNNVIRNFESDGLTRAQAIGTIDETDGLFKQLIEELQPSAQKKELLESIFGLFTDIFVEIGNRYHSYDIVLPIKLENNAQVPTYAHTTDAAADLYATEDITLPAHSLSNLINTGVRIQLPENWVAYVVPRSSIGMKTGLRLSNSIGVIDSSYRGVVGVIYDNISDSDYTIHAGDRIAQLIVAPAYHFKPNVVDILEATERGDGAYGSTGK